MNKIPSMVSVAGTFSFFKERSPYLYLMINSDDTSRRIYNTNSTVVSLGDMVENEIQKENIYC